MHQYKYECPPHLLHLFHSPLHRHAQIYVPLHGCKCVSQSTLLLITKSLLFGAVWRRFRPMMVILVLSNSCKGHVKIHFFSNKMIQNFNLTLSKSVIMFRRHVNSQISFYLIPIEGDIIQQWPIKCSMTTAIGNVKIPIFFFQKISQPSIHHCQRMLYLV